MMHTNVEIQSLALTPPGIQPGFYSQEWGSPRKNNQQERKELKVQIWEESPNHGPVRSSCN